MVRQPYVAFSCIKEARQRPETLHRRCAIYGACAYWPRCCRRVREERHVWRPGTDSPCSPPPCIYTSVYTSVPWSAEKAADLMVAALHFFIFLVLICVAWTTAAPLLAHLPHSGRWRGCRSVGAPLLGMMQKSQWFPPLNLGCQKIAWQDSNSPTARTDSEFPVSNFRFVYLQVDLRKDLHVRKFVFEIIIIQVFIKRKLLSVETIFKAHSKRAFA